MGLSHTTRPSHVWRMAKFPGGYWHKNPHTSWPVTDVYLKYNILYSWSSWWVFLNHFNIFFDALRHESHNRAIRIDLQKRSALGWIFFQGGRMPKGSTKRWYACPHECMFCICFVYFICWMFYIFCRFKSQRKQTQQQEVIKPRYWAHLKKFKDEAFAKGFGWRRFCQRACICHLSLVFFQQILCFCWLSLPLRPSLYLQVKSVFKLPQDTYAGKRSVSGGGMFLPCNNHVGKENLKPWKTRTSGHRTSSSWLAALWAFPAFMFDFGADHLMLKAEFCAPRHMIQEINEKACGWSFWLPWANVNKDSANQPNQEIHFQLLILFDLRKRASSDRFAISRQSSSFPTCVGIPKDHILSF